MTERERRQPRAFFTRALTRICERLDAQDTHKLAWKERSSYQSFRGTLRAESLWVVGSYARGAPSCGDLDLVLQLGLVEGYRGSTKRFASKAFGRSSGVRWYSGDPQSNSSGVAFPEAVHIWSKGVDWRRTISSIPLDEHATRISRPTDAIPLRPEQLYADIEDIEEVLRRRDAGEIAWRFLPVERRNTEQPVAPSEDELGVMWFMQFYGKKTRELFPYLLRYTHEHRLPMHSRYSNRSNAAELELEGTFMAMGRPRISHTRLDTLEFSRVVLMPHFTRRGPNGIWELRHDVKHPLEIRIRTAAAYILQTGDGLPSRVGCVSNVGSECQLISLFATMEQAQENAAELQEELDVHGLTAARTEGSALLEILSYADAIELFTAAGESTLLSLTHRGSLVLREDDDEWYPVQTTESVLDALVDVYG